jgi:hypothetical protein
VGLLTSFVSDIGIADNCMDMFKATALLDLCGHCLNLSITEVATPGQNQAMVSPQWQVIIG